MRSKSTVNRTPNNETDICKISEWEVALGAPDRVNISRLMNDTRHCHVRSMARITIPNFMFGLDPTQN